ncbi:hypothetical protein [Acetobacteroides hydrogenigenes]|uniref:Uncharacterized protein n=1 Tax=Acetobacteroides hydrogenigenes TaxID=979970 RepID=A0A4R2EIR4_9BACT|nr:hypothetical protein [Acetobacteroides hydrogenigenes]TCN68898.1 hypothetical protein CLV25_105100 [Acetobacteroides hydrogenigenes]
MNNNLELKQSLLETVAELKSTCISEISTRLDLDIDICYSILQNIGNEGYIDFRDATTKDGKDAFVKLNGTGILFLQKGGYKSIITELLLENKEKKKDKKLSKVKDYIAIIGTVLSLMFGALAVYQNEKIQQLEVDLRMNNDSLKIIEKQFPEFKEREETKLFIIGKWISNSRNEFSYFIFNDNDTWQHILIRDNVKIIFKGEYQIGKNKGVYLRNFGMYNDKQDTVYNDTKTSIGTMYFYLDNHKLINSQEDYINVYSKTMK